MKFLSSNYSSSPECSREFHKNLFFNGMLKESAFDDDEFDNEDYENAQDWLSTDLGRHTDDEENYMLDEENETEYIRDLEKSSKNFKLTHLSLPLSETIAEFVQDLSDEEFFINDLSFILDMSRKRAISPYALIVALLYLKRLKSKPIYEPKSTNFINGYFNRAVKNATNNTDQPPKGLSNAELCLISIILATKYLVDEGEAEEIYNYEWAECVDLSIKQLNSLERQFLARLNWDLFVSADEFWRFTDHLSERITRKKVIYQSNHCTYSDLECLLSFSNDLISFKSALSQLTKVLLVCSSTLVYIALSTYMFTNTVIFLKNFISSLPSDVPSVDIVYRSNHHLEVNMKKPVEPLVFLTSSHILVNDQNVADVATEKNSINMIMTKTCENRHGMLPHKTTHRYYHPNRVLAIPVQPKKPSYSINSNRSWENLDSIQPFRKSNLLESNIFRNLIEGF